MPLQVANYRSFAEQRSAQLGRSFVSLFDDDTSDSGVYRRVPQSLEVQTDRQVLL